MGIVFGDVLNRYVFEQESLNTKQIETYNNYIGNRFCSGINL